MANQTVIVLSNNCLGALDEPDFVEKLKAAIDQTYRTHQPTEIGIDIGTVMPCHHGYDPKLYLSYGGILKDIGQTTVENLPHTPAEVRKVALDILKVEGPWQATAR